MWSKLLTLSGVLLFVAACETAPDGSAEGAGEGAGGKEVWSVEHEGAGAGGAGAGGGEVGAGGVEVAAVEPTMSRRTSWSKKSVIGCFLISINFPCAPTVRRRFADRPSF